MVAVPIFPQLLLQMPIMPPVVPCGVTMAFEGAPVSETNSSKTVPVELFVTVILTCARAVEAPRIAQNARVKKRKRENEQSRAERKKLFTGPPGHNVRYLAQSCIPTPVLMSRDRHGQPLVAFSLFWPKSRL